MDELGLSMLNIPSLSCFEYPIGPNHLRIHQEKDQKWAIQQFHTKLNPYRYITPTKLMLLTFIFIFWLCWSSHPHKGFLWLQCAGFSLQWLLLLQSTASGVRDFRRCGTRVFLRHVESFPAGEGTVSLHWQMNS